MVNEFTYLIAGHLAEACIQGYKKGINKVINLNKKTITKFSTVNFADKKPSFINADYTTEDEAALKNFIKECFQVAGVGSYELEEKLKTLAVDIWKNGQNFDQFEQEARNLMLQYIPLEDQAPSGWLETNFNTALNSSYSAAQYNRLQDEDVKALYPSYQYKTREDDHVRPEHEALADMIFYNNDPMLDIVWPPNDWNCRCFILPLDEDESKLADIMPIIKDDETVKNITNNVAPDFRRNAGKDKSIFGKWLKTKYNDLPNDIVKEIKSLSKDYSKEYKIK